MKGDRFKYINDRLKERAFLCWDVAVSKSRKGDTKTGTKYMGHTVKGVTNPHHEGFSQARLDDLSDVLTVLSRGEDKETFIAEFIGAADHFFRQEDAVLEKVDAKEKALSIIKKTLEGLTQAEKSLEESLYLLGGLGEFEKLYKFKIGLEKIINSSEISIEEQRSFNRLNNYDEGNIGLGNKEAIIKLFNFFVKVLSKWEIKEGRKKVIDDNFLIDLEKEFFITFLFKDEDLEVISGDAVKVPSKFAGGNKKGITPTVFKVIYQVVDSLGITHIGAETIGKIINKRSEVEIPESILVKADDSIKQIQIAEEELDRASEPYILFPDGTKVPDFYDHVERETPKN